MAADDVASAVGEVAVGPPVNGMVEVAGPEQFRLDELVRRALAARDDPREVVADPHARYFGPSSRNAPCCPAADAEVAQTSYDEWLGQPTARS